MKVNLSHVGKRVLIKENSSSMFETKIEEVSPSGTKFKMNNSWYEIDNYEIVEVLSEKKDDERQLLFD